MASILPILLLGGAAVMLMAGGKKKRKKPIGAAEGPCSPTLGPKHLDFKNNTPEEPEDILQGCVYVMIIETPIASEDIRIDNAEDALERVSVDAVKREVLDKTYWDKRIFFTTVKPGNASISWLVPGGSSEMYLRVVENGSHW